MRGKAVTYRIMNAGKASYWPAYKGYQVRTDPPDDTHLCNLHTPDKDPTESMCTLTFFK